MILIIKEIADKKIWENFVFAQPDYTFLNSWDWGEFNLKMGYKIWRLGIFKDDQRPTTNDRRPISAILIIKIKARRGTFLFLPHFQQPTTNNQQLTTETFKVLIDYLKKLAKEEGCAFVRISPLLDDDEKNKLLFKNLKFKPAPIHMHAEIMWILDLRPDEEKLLADMRKTTRYLVRKSEKEGVEIFQKNDIEGVEMFNQLYRKTIKRQHFAPFSLEYLKNEFSSFAENNRISVLFAKYQGEIISGAIIVFYGNSAFYHHGASSLKYQKIPAAYLLQWEIIKEAKRRGCNFYNFWGIAKQNQNSKIKNQNDKSKLKIILKGQKEHPWAGLTLFKTGFGGFRKDYLHAQDLAINCKYWFNYLIEVIRRKKRGL